VVIATLEAWVSHRPLIGDKELRHGGNTDEPQRKHEFMKTLVTPRRFAFDPCSIRISSVARKTVFENLQPAQSSEIQGM
jgi:hypothetical protein